MSNLKFLVLGVSCGITVLGMNSVYADDSSIKEFLNEKEAYGLEVKVKKPSPVQVKKTSNVNETKLNLDTSKLNLVENDKSKSDETKQLKTHFGIGYEYRKNLWEQAQKTERVIRPEKIQQTERTERPERISKPKRVNRPNSSGRKK